MVEGSGYNGTDNEDRIAMTLRSKLNAFGVIAKGDGQGGASDNQQSRGG